MLEELFAIHGLVMGTTPTTTKRYLYDHINWEARAICLYGERGVGKTTLLCQYLLNRYKTVDKALYISADNIYVAANGLFDIARTFFSLGGEALFIDEIHKYPNWEVELKNIIDTYRRHQIVFSGSSTLDLTRSKADLSRRVVYHRLPGLSFREYLFLQSNVQASEYALQDILQNHVKIADQFKSIPILKYFKNYLEYGYYPFFLEGTQDYLAKLHNIIEKTIFEDIAVIYNLRQTTLPILKKLLWLVATSHILQPNVDKISKNLAVSREVIYQSFEYLSHAGLINTLYADAKGMKLVRKPGKVFLANSNLLYAVNGELKLDTESGGVRETFFVNQLMLKNRLNVHDQGDFIVDGKYIIEVGGKGKTNKQIKQIPDAYLAIDDIEIGMGHRVPLYLFGLLY